VASGTARRDPAAWLATLPMTDKHTYIDRYCLAQRCRGGVVPTVDAELDESSGSSGTPYTWVRGAAELRETHATMAILARHLLDHDDCRDRPLVTLNGFSMGAWATGTNVTAALKRLGVVKSTGPDTEKMFSAMKLLGPDRVYVIAGYPPFLRRLLDVAREQQFDLSAYTMFGVVGGEGMSEALRSRLERDFKAVYSAYGASDLDIGVAAETPLSIEIRRLAACEPGLALALFGTPSRLPMVFDVASGIYWGAAYDRLGDHHRHQRGLGAKVAAGEQRRALQHRAKNAGAGLARDSRAEEAALGEIPGEVNAHAQPQAAGEQIGGGQHHAGF